MPDPRLTPVHLRSGIWRGMLAHEDEAPVLEATHLGVPVAGLALTALADRPGHWTVEVPVPPAALSDGVQTVVIRDAGSGLTLGHFAIVCGTALEPDLRVEVDLLRAELELLKRAVRRGFHHGDG